MSQEIFIYEVLCLSGRWGVNAYKVTALKQILKVRCVLEAQSLFQSWVLRTSMNNNIELKRLSSLKYKLGNVSKTDKANCTALNASAVRKHSLVPFLLSQKLNTFGDASVNAENEA